MPTENRVVITQPTYCPWLGYFNLMANADTFIFLDNVQFEKRSWQQRNKIKGPGGCQWLTVPVQTKGRFEQRINEVEIAHQSWQKQHLNTIKHLYAHAPFFHDVFDFLSDIYTREWTKLLDLNLTIINNIVRRLGLSPRFLRASDLSGHGKKADLLIDLCRKAGATHYLSGQAAQDYISSDDLFAHHGITLEYQSFSHPIYPQLHGEFISHLSILDVIMNIGWDKTGELTGMRKG